MGWIANIFKGRKEKQQGNKSVAQTFKGYEPKFTDFGKNILASMQILESIRLKSEFVSKVDPKYIRETKDGIKIRETESSIAKILKRPNQYMTKTDFFYKANFIREVAKNCFIFVDSYTTQGGYKKYTGMYILQPTLAEMYEDENGNLWWGFEFQSQSGMVFFKKEEIVHWTKHYEDLQYKGGGDYTRNSEADMLHALQGYHQILESIAEASKCACYFDGILKVNAYTSTDKKTQEIRDKFINDLRTNKSGVAVLDNGAEWQDINRKLTMVDEKTMAHFQQQIEIFTGTPIDMLRGKFTVADKEAFYERNIEACLISLGEAFSMCFFGDWQTTHGDEIVLYHKKVELMSTTQISQLIRDTIVAGVFKKDEYRDMLGYAPLEDGKGQEMPRGYNYLDGGSTMNQVNNTTQASEVKDE